jgi:hypothetical protein
MNTFKVLVEIRYKIVPLKIIGNFLPLEMLQHNKHYSIKVLNGLFNVAFKTLTDFFVFAI